MENRHAAHTLGAAVALARTITWAEPLAGQLSALELDNVTIERVVRYLSQPAARRDDLRRKRLERKRRDLALDHAAGRIGDAEYLAEVARVREHAEVLPAPARAPDPARAVRRLRDFAGLWNSRSKAERAAMLNAVYARVEVRGEQFIAADLTSDAKELGLTVALPETFAMARPADDGHALTNIPIVGRREWESAIQSA